VYECAVQDGAHQLPLAGLKACGIRKAQGVCLQQQQQQQQCMSVLYRMVRISCPWLVSKPA
jgi:hypothetical protein